MKTRSLCCGAIFVSLTFLIPFSVFGQEYKNDLAVKAGIYATNGDLDDFDLGFSGEVACRI